jgi:methyl-accepting chemotaxis protein/hemerythrin
MMNELHAAMKQGQDKQRLQAILDRLKAYAVEHFETEEKLFDRHGYPETAEHIKEHEAFVGKVLDFDEAFRSGRVTLDIDVMKFLTDWLKHHIKKVDKRYGPFLNQAGVR